MSLTSVGSMVSASVINNVATLTNYTVQSTENMNYSMWDRIALFKLTGDVDVTTQLLNAANLDVGEIGSTRMMQSYAISMIKTGTVTPSVIVSNDINPVAVQIIPLSLNSLQSSETGLTFMTMGDAASAGANIPQHLDVTVTISRRGDKLRITSHYAGEDEVLPATATLDAIISPGFEPYLIANTGVLPDVPNPQQETYQTTVTCTLNDVPLIDFKGEMDGVALNGLVIDEGKLKISETLQKVMHPPIFEVNYIDSNAKLNDGDRLRYKVATAASNGSFTFGLMASDYLGVGDVGYNPIRSQSFGYTNARVFDVLVLKTDSTDPAKIMRNDPKWNMTIDAGPYVSPSDQLSLDADLEYVVVRLGNQYIRYLEAADGMKYDIKRFNGLPPKPGYEVISFTLLNPIGAFDGTDLVPEKECEVRFTRETVSPEERAELLALTTATFWEEQLALTANYDSTMLDERGSISFKAGENTPGSASFDVNLARPMFFELEFDPTDRNKSYYLNLTHNQPNADFDIIRVSIHSDDGVSPHMLKIGTYLNGGPPTLVSEQNLGFANTGFGTNKAGVILTLTADGGGSTTVDVMRHDTFVGNHHSSGDAYAIIYDVGGGDLNSDFTAELTVEVQSHADMVPGSLICNYNKSDYNLKRTMLGYARERAWLGGTATPTRNLTLTEGAPELVGNAYIGTLALKILPETSMPWHRESPPDGSYPLNDERFTATGLMNFSPIGSNSGNYEFTLPFANHADARFYILNNSIFAVNEVTLSTDTTYWRQCATVIRNVGNVIYLDVYDQLAQIITRTTLATITGSDELDNYRFVFKTVKVDNVHKLVCTLTKGAQVLWTSPNYPAISVSELWGKYIAAFYEVDAAFDMTDGYELPVTQFKIVMGA